MLINFLKLRKHTRNASSWYVFLESIIPFSDQILSPEMSRAYLFSIHVSRLDIPPLIGKTDCDW